MLTFAEIKNNETIKTYIRKADESLAALGYTEHSFAHVLKVAATAKMILKTLGYSKEDIELVQIAAYLHDIGNLVNRDDHAQSGAVMVFNILRELGASPSETAAIVTAIGNHDEGTGVAVNPISAALIIADKCDVRRTRVRNADITSFDIHDRVNYSVKKATVTIDEEKTAVELNLKIDTKYFSVLEYFEIFLYRMVFSRKAAEKLGLAFHVTVNGQRLI